MNIKSRIQGHSEQIFKLENAIEQKRLPHAILLTGLESIGKKMVALALAQKLICESHTACGVCPACLRVAKQQSENLMVIEPSGQNIKIDQTREIFNFLSLANFGMNRVIIIDQAHLFNPQAANSILKVLEEPGENVYFILIAPEADSVLSTIRSRSQVIRFSPLTLAQMKSIKPGLADWIYQCSRGQMCELTNLSDSEGSEKRMKSFELLDSFWNEPSFLQDNTWRLNFKDRETAVGIIKNWILIMRDVVVLKMDQTDKLLNGDQIEKIKKFIFLDGHRVNLFISSLMKAEKDILRNTDSTLVVEGLWVSHARH